MMFIDVLKVLPNIYDGVFCKNNQRILAVLTTWHCDVMVITTVQLHSTMSETWFCTDSNPANDVPKFETGKTNDNDPDWK